ncbi:uncharacterized protein (DUF305 family) [Mycolicibacterium sp. BK556]|uniref:DUF305 domain-containing protein n=1 Tax=Mycobacteriaceae TaxID=1762 RepID=UPI001060C5C1|nr:DUF305 domain-containing protein [Mycobacterium sp. BK086]MBB3600872.1 uncharacterized protein (DUF305 family) [Mycolicibacterium sp. BK556]MBB3630626.1 uncharacterized protein (DUF305 family) [Mycolicibacterium sp. BK607]MBB3748620.1 uncharacterized protein (DUF305 family) [Mycolicibacterium sp. BK634]TDO10414.1 uncharacterized protein (DUF305 family) [Mycobacterium sp. BK086]
MKQARIVATGAAVFAAVFAIGACSNSGTKETTSSSQATARSSSSAPASAHNQSDMMFAHMMIPHHQQAIEMSDMVLAKQGIDPRVIDLAKQIKAAQEPEIDQMQGWLNQWGMSGMPGMNNMPGMHGTDTATVSPTSSAMPMPMPSGSMMPGMAGMDGMMSMADMQALQNANGVEASKLYLAQMIKHHQGAITMAQGEIKNGQFTDAIALAKSIATSQQKEIDTMNQILSSL